MCGSQQSELVKRGSPASVPSARGLLCPVRVRLHALETAQVRLQWGTLEGTAIGACSVHTRHDDMDKIETLQEPLTLRRPQGNVGYDTSAIIPMEGAGVLLLRRLGTHSAGPLLSRRSLRGGGVIGEVRGDRGGEWASHYSRVAGTVSESGRFTTARLREWVSRRSPNVCYARGQPPGAAPCNAAEVRSLGGQSRLLAFAGGSASSSRLHFLALWNVVRPRVRFTQRQSRILVSLVSQLLTGGADEKTLREKTREGFRLFYSPPSGQSHCLGPARGSRSPNARPRTR